jgi:hypothetical protein
MTEPGDDTTVILLDEIPARLRNQVSLRSVRDPAWRHRVGLRVIRVGRKILGVRPEDLEAVMKRGF